MISVAVPMGRVIVSVGRNCANTHLELRTRTVSVRSFCNLESGHEPFGVVREANAVNAIGRFELAGGDEL